MLRRYWDPFAELRRLEKEIDRLFSEFTSLEPFEERTTGFTPAIDLYETPESLVLKVELPGFKPEDVDISVTEDQVVLQGETKEEEEVKGENIYRRERRYGRVYRRINLPKSIIPDKTEAVYKNGVLTLTLPKAKPEKLEGIKIKIREEK